MATMTTRQGMVSVVIPTYNFGRFVCDAVQSALAQTYSRIEVIVVDDGSTDDTRERVACYGRRIRYVYQVNGGLSAARNTGIRNAGGDWIALLDSDDVWHPEKLEVQLRALDRRSDAALIGSPAAEMLPQRLELDPAVRELTVRDFLLSARMGPSSALIRRECLNAVGPFDEMLRSIEDRDMWLRIAARFPCLLVDSPCWWYRRHANQMNRNADRMLKNYDRVLRKFFDQQPEYGALKRLAFAYMYYDSSWSWLEQGQPLKALSHLVQSVWYYPKGMDDAMKPRHFRLRIALRAALAALGRQRVAL